MAPADFMSSFSNGELERKMKIPPTTTIISSITLSSLGEFCLQHFAIPGRHRTWQIYLLVSDCDVVATKAQCLGAKLLLPPMKIEDIGRKALRSRSSRQRVSSRNSRSASGGLFTLLISSNPVSGQLRPRARLCSYHELAVFSSSPVSDA